MLSIGLACVQPWYGLGVFYGLAACVAQVCEWASWCLQPNPSDTLASVFQGVHHVAPSVTFNMLLVLLPGDSRYPCL